MSKLRTILPRGFFSTAEDLIERHEAKKPLPGKIWQQYLTPGRQLRGEPWVLKKEELDWSGLSDLPPETLLSKDDLIERMLERYPRIEFSDKPGSSGRKFNKYRDYVLGGHDWFNTDRAARLAETNVLVPVSPFSYGENLSRMKGVDHQESRFHYPGVDNYLSHSRHTDRPLLDEGKVVPNSIARYLEEIQSDLHKGARKAGGYQLEGAREKAADHLATHYDLGRRISSLSDAIDQADWEMTRAYHPGELEAAQNKRDELMRELVAVQPQFDAALSDYVKMMKELHKPPSMPFKNDDYVDLELKKHLIDMANSKKNYSHLAVTPGRVQRDRYGQMGIIKGLSGLRDFYDNTVMGRLRKLGRQLGQDELSETSIPFALATPYRSPPNAEALPSKYVSVSNPSIRFTPEVRKRLLERGLPFFSASPLSLLAMEDEE